jgi:hypothetical protein
MANKPITVFMNSMQELPNHKGRESFAAFQACCR